MPKMLALANIDLFIKVTEIYNGKYWVLAEDDGEYVIIHNIVDLEQMYYYQPLWTEDRNLRGEIIQEIDGIIFTTDKPEDNVPCLVLQGNFLVVGCIKDNVIYFLTEEGYITSNNEPDFIFKYDVEQMPDFTVNEDTHFYLLPPIEKDD